MLCKIKSKLSLLLLVVILLEVFIFPLSYLAEAKDLNNVLDEITVSQDGPLDKNKQFQVNGTWSLEDGQAKEGDSFTVRFSKNINLALLKGRLPLIGSDGAIYAYGVLNKSEGTITFTFTDEVEKRSDVGGTFTLQGLLLKVEDPDPDKGIENKPITIEEDGGKSFYKEVEIDNNGFDIIGGGPVQPGEDYRKKNFEKIGQIITDPMAGETSLGDMYWYVYVNAKEESERFSGPILVEDKLKEGHKINMASFSMTIADLSNDNDDGETIYYNREIKTENFDKYISNFKMDEKSYSLTFNPDIGYGPKALRIYYHTIIDDDAIDQTKFENTYNAYTDDGREIIQNEEVDFAAMLGTGHGYEGYKGQMKINKVDQDGNLIKKPGAKFRIRVKPGKETYYNKGYEKIVYTDSDGIARIDDIYAGTYLVKELEAPTGYIKDGEEKEILINYEEIKKLNTEIQRIEASIEEYESRKDENPEYYENLIIKEEFKLKQKKIQLGASQNRGLNFTFKNQARDFEKTSMEIYKKWEMQNKSRSSLSDLEAHFYLTRSVISYDEEGNPSVKTERVANSDKKLKYSEDTQRLVWNNLDKLDELGREYIYTVKEEESDDYKIKYENKDGKLYITNCVEGEEIPETIDIAVEKKWQDKNGNILNENLPSSVIVDVYKDKKPYISFKLVKENGYKEVLKDLDKYEVDKNGNKRTIKYELEEQPIDGYTSQVLGSQDSGFTIVNTASEKPPTEPQEPLETTEIKIEKRWVDSDGNLLKDSEIPESIVITVYADGVAYLSGKVLKGEYSGYRIENLPKYNKKGKEIVYSVKENFLEGCKEPIIEEISKNNFLITNEKREEKPPVEPEETVDLELSKEWIGVEDEEIPSHIIISVYADGVEHLAGRVWKKDYDSYTIKNLPKYNKDGKEIEYTIKELRLDGYMSPKIEKSGKYKFKLINEKEGDEKPPVEPEELVDLKVEKKWIGVEDLDLPNYIIIEVYADGVEYLAGRVPKEHYSSYIIENLPKYNEEGKEINYTIKEVRPEGYKEPLINKNSSYDFTVVNERDEEEYPPINQETIDVSLKKLWDEEPDNLDYIIVNLKRNDQDYLRVRVSKDNNWEYTFRSLEKYDSKGKEYKYSLEEEKVPGYKFSLSGNIDEGYVLKNTKVEEETIDVEVEKKWIKSFGDNNLPNYIRLQIYKDGEPYLIGRLLKDRNWKGKFRDLPKYNEEGKEIVYDIEELPVEGFIYEKFGNFKDGFKFINIEEQEPEFPGPEDDTIDIEVEKKWDGKKLNSIEVYLLVNGKKYKKIDLNSSNNYRAIFKNLPRKLDGKIIDYSVEEEILSDYKVTIEGNSKDGFTIKNEYIEEEKPNKPTKPNRPDRPDKDDSKKYKDLTLKKYWDGKKLNKVTFKLMDNNGEVEKVELSDDNNWTWTFKDLDKNKDYYIVEEKLDNYEVKIYNSEDGFVVYNTEIKEDGPKDPEKPEEPQDPELPEEEKPVTPEDPKVEKPEGPTKPSDKDEDLDIEEEYPLGPIRPGKDGPISKLPKTGEELRFIIYLIGFTLIILGVRIRKN